jgi:hypothetical protein
MASTQQDSILKKLSRRDFGGKIRIALTSLFVLPAAQLLSASSAAQCSPSGLSQHPDSNSADLTREDPTDEPLNQSKFGHTRQAQRRKLRFRLPEDSIEEESIEQPNL